MEVELTVDDKLAAAFMAAYVSYPYFSSGLAILVRRFAEIPSATMAVTRDGILLVDPRCVAKWEAEQIGEVLVHELSHLLRDHAGRADVVQLVDRRRWNVAADCEINCGLRLERLPGKPCLPTAFGLPDHLLAEEYYEKLPPEKEWKRQVAGAGAGDCGSGSGGEKAFGEPDEEGGGGEGRSKSDLARVRQEVAAAVVERAAKGRGDVPADLLRWAKGQLLPPKISWRDKLGRVVRSGVAAVAGKVDYAWRRPNRRQSCYGAVARSLGGEVVLMPSLEGRKPRVAVGVDTSGSMSEGQLGRCMSEVEGLLRALGVPAAFLACDCKVTESVREVRKAAEAVSCLRGGGGTDFRVVMEHVEKKRPRPDLFVFMTDGMGPAPASPPKGVRVVWVLVGSWVERPASWGDYVVVEEK